MAAICGVIKLDGSAVPESMGANMMDKLNFYSFNESKTIYSQEMFMGCGIQYTTPESINEVLPFHDAESLLTITADAIIDNRDEIFNLLNITMSERKNMTDSQIILMSFKKWGKECTRYLVGDFTFAIWDENNKELFCARDHVGKRTFYYYYSKEIFAFCTVIKPLFAVSDKEVELNDAWVVDFLFLEGVAHEIGGNSTVYKDIYQLAPANELVLKEGKMSTRLYWDPLEVKELKYKSDEEYEEAFREVFFEAVKCRLRSVGSVGVMLSGGLDSGAVACVAAKQLSETGKRLQAFSSIPFSSYKDYLPKSLMADESSYIQAIVEHAKNIDLSLFSCEGKHSLTKLNFLLDVFEQPYKIIQNIFWLDEITEAAAKNGCSVLLDGQFGNSTISYGDFTTHVITLFQQGRLLSFLREIREYSKVKNISTLKVGKYICKKIIPSPIQNLIRRRELSQYNDGSTVPVNEKLLNQFKVKERFKAMGFYDGNYTSYNLSQVRKLIMRPMMFEQLAPTETKISLAYGIAKRDPTRDKRVIEFCFSVPADQYVRQGNDRYLIRRAMKDIMPDQVRLNTNKRGRQGADWIQRLQPHWGGIQNEMMKITDDDRLKSYLDINKLRTNLLDHAEILNENQEDAVHGLIISYIFACFINQFD